MERPPAPEAPTTEPVTAPDAVARAWAEHRRHLLDIAFRMVGGLSEAEDVVQEAYARLLRADIDAIDDVGGWLVVVVSRLCLDRLRAGRRHPTAPDAALGERPAERAVDPADRVTLDDSVRLALQLVLGRLSAAERTAFVLHDVFRYPFEAIAEIVGRSPAACRQLASRARRAVRAEAGPDRFVVEPEEQRRITERFIAACTTGDIDGLLAVLDPDVEGVADVGGAIGVRVAAGSARVAALLLQYFGPQTRTTLLTLPAGDDAVLVALRGGRVVTVATLGVHDGRIAHIDGIVDPAKLEPISTILGG
jgi:RNA polymerase sigma-70 factor (ECF subfamily)